MSSFLGIEIGGTKVVLGHGSGPGDLKPTVRVPTRSPENTISDIIRAARTLIQRHGEVTGIGIASFGPLGVTPGTPSYGHILSTPKPGFSHFDLLSAITTAFPNKAFGLDTDVNGAALGEGIWGAAVGLGTFAYITVGTGIGVGIVSNGAPVHGLLHPEAGHILIRRQADLDPYAGCCPFHGDCLEGLASGPAIAERMGKPGEEIAEDDPVWNLAAGYIAQLCYNLVLIASPQRILLGGGVGSHPRVLQGVREHLHKLMGTYIEALAERPVFDSFVTAPGLGDLSGVLGAIALARNSAGT